MANTHPRILTEKITLLVSPALRDKVLAEARFQGVSVNELVRRALEEYISGPS